MRMVRLVLLAWMLASSAVIAGSCAVSGEEQHPEPLYLTDEEWQQVRMVSTLTELEALPDDMTRIGLKDLGLKGVEGLRRFGSLKAVVLYSEMNERGPPPSGPDNRYGFTDDAIRVLASMGTVTNLLIVDGEITDKSMKTLASMRSLRQVWIVYCDYTTREGVARFMKMRPDVQVLEQSSYD